MLHTVPLTITPELEAKFDGGVSFIEDYAEDYYGLTVTFVRDTEKGPLYNVTGGGLALADFIEYLVST